MKTLLTSSLVTFSCCFVQAQAPSVAFSLSDSIVCAGECVDFTDLSANQPTSWEWRFAGASIVTSTDQHPQAVCFPNAGNYSVSLKASNAEGSQTIIMRVRVREAIETPTVSVVGTTLSTGIYTAYKWYYNGETISGAASPAYTAKHNGNYAVEVTGSEGCTAISQLTNIDNVGHELEANGIRVFPNPSGGAFTINRGVSQPQVMEIVSADGKVLMMKTLNKISETIDMHGYRNGTYFIRVHQEENVVVEQIKLEK